MSTENQKSTSGVGGKKRSFGRSVFLYLTWFLGFPFFGVLILFEKLPYANFDEAFVCNGLVDKTIMKQKVKNRINLAFSVYLVVLWLVYWMLRKISQKEGWYWYDIIAFLIGAGLFYGGNFCREFQLAVYPNEAVKDISEY